MDLNIKIDEWNDFFKEFNKKNKSRPSKLEIFDEHGTQTEVKGLPLLGIDVEVKGSDLPIINFILGDLNETGRHLSHNIPQVNKVNVKVGDDGVDQVLEIESNNNVKTLLTFETLRELGT